MGLWKDLLGTTKAYFQIAIGGVKLGNSSGNLTVKDTGDSPADITVKKAFLTGDEIEVNSDAAGNGADWKLTLKRAASGMTAALDLVFPPADGSPNQVLKTDGSGNLGWANAGTTTQCVTVDSTDLAFDASSPVAMFNLPVGAVVVFVKIIIDTPFNGTAPSLSIGVAGTASKYMAATQVNLKGAAKDIYECEPAEAAISGSPEAVIATYAADSSSAGAARIEVGYTIPT